MPLFGVRPPKENVFVTIRDKLNPISVHLHQLWELQPEARRAFIYAVCEGKSRGEKRERVKGIEPSYAAWEAAVLPLNYTRRIEVLK